MRQGPIFKELITQYLPEYPIIVEAGAHIGRDTVRMSTLWPHAQIHAFEPVSSLYQELLERTAPYPQVICYQIALSDHSGIEQFYISSGASTAVSSFYEPSRYTQERPNVLFEKTNVPTITLDTWAEQHSVSHVDTLWLDMQGAERKVLTASPRILSTVRVMVVEASLIERFEGIPLYDELLPWIEAQGFDVIQQDAPKHHKVNLLCVRSFLIR
jgi:FkbM family methyltransferase